MVASKIKASDRSKVCQQIVTILKKEYGTRPPSYDYDVLDTLLFSICLENSNFADAEDALQRLKDNFFDYNELRVSSITEIQNAFVNMSEPEWRAMRVRDVLQFVFESGYTYDVEDLKKKTMDSAEKHLKKIKSLKPFSIAHTLLYALGSHLVPVSDRILSTSIWLGLLEPKTKVKAAGEQLKGAVRKSDVPLFYYLFSCLVSDSRYQKYFESVEPADPENPLESLKGVPDRLKELIAGKLKVPQKKKDSKPAAKKAEKPALGSPKKSAGKKKPAAKVSTKPATSKTKSAAKSVTTKKKTVKKETTSKKKVAKKPAKKPATKKGSAKKTLASIPKKAAKKPAKKSAKKTVKKKVKTTKKSRK